VADLRQPRGVRHRHESCAVGEPVRRIEDVRRHQSRDGALVVAGRNRRRRSPPPGAASSATAARQLPRTAKRRARMRPAGWCGGLRWRSVRHRAIVPRGRGASRQGSLGRRVPGASSGSRRAGVQSRPSMLPTSSAEPGRWCRRCGVVLLIFFLFKFFAAIRRRSSPPGRHQEQIESIRRQLGWTSRGGSSCGSSSSNRLVRLRQELDDQRAGLQHLRLAPAGLADGDGADPVLEVCLAIPLAMAWPISAAR